MAESIKDIFLPYQTRWVADTCEVKIAEKSRRIGLTWAEAADTVLKAAAENGSDVFYISYNMEFTKEFIQTCAEWAQHLNYAAGELEEILIRDDDKDVTAYRITFPSGHKILGLPSRATTLRGRQGRVVIDEAAFCENLAELLKAALALLMWGGDVRIISTHNGEDNPFNELIKDVRDGKKPYSHHRITINDAITEGLYRRICERKQEQWSKEKERQWLSSLVDFYGEGASEELFCVPARGGQKYLSRALVESCMSHDIEVLRYECTDEFTFEDESVRVQKTLEWINEDLESILRNQDDRPTYVGMDFARSGDLSVINVSREETNNLLRAIVYVEMRNVPFAQQYQILTYIIDNLNRFYSGSFDARGNGQMIAELAAQKYGQSYIHQVMPTRQFYMEYMPKYKARFEDREILIPNTPDILDDHRIVVLDKGVPSIPDARTSEGTGKKKRHGDSVIAGVMVVHAKDNDDSSYQPYKYEPVHVDNPWGVKETHEW